MPGAHHRGLHTGDRFLNELPEALFLAAAKASLPLLELTAARKPLDDLLEGLSVERFEGGVEQA